MKIFISGGCKNGKSTLAESCACALAGDGPLYYLATMIPHDEEDEARIRRHVAQRAGKGFTTVERGREILQCLEEADPEGTFLLDSVTALFANEMFHDGIADRNAAERTAEELRCLAERVKNIVFVSDFIFSDDGRYDEFTEEYRRGLALCDRTLAGVSDTVAEVCTGHYTLYKGEMPVRQEGEKRWI